jgi:hypothetical protein
LTLWPTTIHGTSRIDVDRKADISVVIFTQILGKLWGSFLSVYRTGESC